MGKKKLGKGKVNIDFKMMEEQLLEQLDDEEDKEDKERIIDDIEDLKSMSAEKFISTIENMNKNVEEYIREMCCEDEANDEMINYANKKCLELFLEKHPNIKFDEFDDEEKEHFIDYDSAFNKFKDEIPKNKRSEDMSRLYSRYCYFIMDSVKEGWMRDNIWDEINRRAIDMY